MAASVYRSVISSMPAQTADDVRVCCWTYAHLPRWISLQPDFKLYLCFSFSIFGMIGTVSFCLR